ncbi:hypothetical protein Fot_55521 [Forsythia ovata]|uniref:Uncharacterized protein n=1 Tax=Forsythia ovata TaxID=205694 RepID=A0ABD1P4C9_9LAMI
MSPAHSRGANRRSTSCRLEPLLILFVTQSLTLSLLDFTIVDLLGNHRNDNARQEKKNLKGLKYGGQLLRSSIYFKESFRTDVGKERDNVGFTVFLVLLDSGYCLCEDEERVSALVKRDRERIAGVVWCGALVGIRQDVDTLTGVRQGGGWRWLSGFWVRGEDTNAQKCRERVSV